MKAIVQTAFLFIALSMPCLALAWGISLQSYTFATSLNIEQNGHQAPTTVLKETPGTPRQTEN